MQGGVKQRKILRNELPDYGKHEGQRAIPRILRFGPTGEGIAQRGGERGKWQLRKVQIMKPKGERENSGRTNRIGHNGKGFDTSDSRRREDV